MTITWTHYALVGIAAAGCGASTARPVPVAVMADNRAAVGPLAANAVRGLDLQPLDIPASTPPAVDVVSPTLVRARSAYSQGEFDACRRELAALDVGELLARGARDHAARALAYESACAFGAHAKTEASAAATKL